MFPKFLKKLAGKAGLDNIRMDLEKLTRKFPHDPTKSSQYIFSIHQEICFAFANQVSPQEVKSIIDRACQNDDSGLQQILYRLLELNIARFDGDQATALVLDKEMHYFFLCATGVPIDVGQQTLLQKRARR